MGPRVFFEELYMRNRLVSLFVATLMVMCAMSASAAEEHKRARVLGGFGDFGLVSTTIKKEVSNEQGLGSWGAGLMMGGGLNVGRVVIAGIQGEGEFTKDKDPFWNSTTGGNLKSTVMVFGLTCFAGVQTPGIKVSSGGTQMRLGVNYGKAWSGAKRSIGNCYNCDSESLRVRGGEYLEPNISFGRIKDGKGGTFYLSARRYTNSDRKFTILTGARMFF